MSTPHNSSPEYVAARRVLLDVLEALRPHLDAVVLVGAQAVYLAIDDRVGVENPAQVAAALRTLTGRMLDSYRASADY